MFDYPTVFVDIETTGGSYRNSRVLEVAALRFENGEVVREFSTLINPGTRVPANITSITGIRNSDITDAPAFETIAEELLEVMDGAVFVAHNVRFDYSFLKNEFAMVGIDWSPKLLCTVRLSRALYSQQKGHSLEKLIARHEIPVFDRHRALEDARAILYFTQLAFRENGHDVFQEAIAKQLKTQYLPPNLDMSEVNSIGNVPGVYIFKDENHQPIYIGKSVSLKKRILSHFTDPATKELKISQNVFHVETITTGSELAALILESRLIKEQMPIYNRMLRRVSLYAMLYKSGTEGYSTLTIKSGNVDGETDFDKIYGMYPTRTKAKAKLIELTKTFELCPKLMGIEKTNGACFSYSLGKCRGACIGEESIGLYNRRFELALEHTKLSSWPYESAVTVPINSEGESVIINNWIVQGYIDQYGETVLDYDKPTFDVDEYKITRRFIRENQQFIRPFESFA